MGLVLLTLGLMLFMEGLKLALVPLGELLGSQLPKKVPLYVVLLVAFFLGISGIFQFPFRFYYFFFCPLSFPFPFSHFFFFFLFYKEKIEKKKEEKISLFSLFFFFRC